MQKILDNNKHPTGLWYAIFIYMFEYFSYYGMRVLLIFYLTEELLMKQNDAYLVYGSYTALVYLTPLFGGYMADKVIGYRNAVILGGFLMAIGHLILVTSGQDDSMFLAMSFIICGYGFFKSNISCLVGQMYDANSPKRNSGFTLLYIGGNIGGIVSPIVCGYLAYKYTWHYGFSAAGIGMLIGLLVFIYGRKHLPNFVPYSDSKSFFSKTSIKSLITFLVITSIIILIYFTLEYGFAGYLILAVFIFSIIWLIYLYANSTKQIRKRLHLIFLFIAFGTVFWVFNEQLGSSIEMFIHRNLSDELFGFIIPSTTLPALNPFSLVVGGLIISWLIQRKNKIDNSIKRMIKFGTGFILQLICFVFFILAAMFAIKNGGQAGLYWAVFGLLFLGISEIFIDPIALSEITAIGGTRYSGMLSAIYMLITGSVASFIASKLASTTSIDTKISNLVDQAHLFLNLFINIASVLAILIVLWFSIVFIIKIVSKN